MSGGAYIRLKDGNIEIHAPGVIDNKASAFPHAGPKEVAYKFDKTPAVSIYDEKFVMRTPAGELISQAPYKITNTQTNEEVSAQTTQSGETLRMWTESAEKLILDFDFPDFSGGEDLISKGRK